MLAVGTDEAVFVGTRNGSGAWKQYLARSFHLNAAHLIRYVPDSRAYFGHPMRCARGIRNVPRVGRQGIRSPSAYV